MEMYDGGTLDSTDNDDVPDILSGRSVSSATPQQNATLTPAPAEVTTTPVTASATPASTEVAEPNVVRRNGVPLRLSPEQAKLAKTVENSININQPISIQNIDKDLNSSLSEFNTEVLSRAKLSDLGDSASLILDIRSKAQSLDPKNLMNTGNIVSRVFGSAKGKVLKAKAKIETVEQQFTVIVNRLEADSQRLETDMRQMERLYVLNREQFFNLEAHIFGAQKKLDEITNVTIPEFEKAAMSGDQMKAHELMQIKSGAELLDKKISDMIELRLDCLQTAQIIHIINENARLLVDSNRNAIYGAVEQWKKGVAIALTLNHQKAAAEMNLAVKDMTNELRINNAKMLEGIAVSVAEASERGAIDFKVLETVNTALINTMDKIQKVHADAKVRRAEEGKKMLELEMKLQRRAFIGKS